MKTEQNNTEKVGKTITFYSYKGGVGRTMSLVNIACLIAKQNKKVLLIDWDLEAPGLHNFFKQTKPKEVNGFVDLMTDVIAETKKESANNEVAYVEFLTNNLHQYIQNGIKIDRSEYKLDIITAGKFDSDYTHKLNQIDWIAFYKESPSFFRTFAQYLETQYDYILIDSRTGLSDTGGVCTMLMPQILIVVFALNSQNLEGVFDVAKQSINYRFDSNDFRDLRVLPLPSRIDNQNSADLGFWINKYTLKFEELFKEAYLLDECKLVNYFDIAKIPYKPEHAYGEKLPVLTESLTNDLFISFHYAQFYNLVEDDNPIWEILSKEELEINRKLANTHFQEGVQLFYANNFEAANIQFEKSCTLDLRNETAFFNWGITLGKLAENKQEKEVEELYHQCFEKYEKAIEIKPDYYVAYNNWGTTLGNLAETKQGKEAEELYHQSFEKYQKAIEIKPDYNVAYNNWGTDLGNLAKTKEGKEAEELYHQSFEEFQKSIEIKPENHQAYINWGTDLGNLAKTKEGAAAEQLYHQAFEKFQKAIEIKIDNREAYYNWGTYLGDLAKTKEGAAAEQLYHQAFAKFQKAIEIKPDNHEAYNNLGTYLGYLAMTKEGAVAEKFYHQSFEKYQKAIDIKPDNHEPYNNWGTFLGNLAQTKEGKEAEELYHQSFEKFQKAIEIKPDYHEAYNNWGTYLGKLAQTKERKEAEELYHQSFEKYQKAIEIKPDKHDAYNNWGTSFGKLAQTKEGKEAEELLIEALEKSKKAFELGGHCYNLACVYALLKNKTDALFYLDMSLSKKEISVVSVENDDDWESLKDDTDFKNILEKYR